jgi:hypothetical protein
VPPLAAAARAIAPTISLTSKIIDDNGRNDYLSHRLQQSSNIFFRTLRLSIASIATIIDYCIDREDRRLNRPE